MDREELRRMVEGWDEYTKAFIHSPVYVEGVNPAVKRAAFTFKVTIYLNVALFAVGLGLLVVAAIVTL